MNDRLPAFVSESQEASIAFRADLIPDETTFNYANRIALLTGAVDRQQTVATLFGYAHIRVERPLHAGFGHFTRQFIGAVDASSECLAEAHSMLSLFKPFISQERYERALKLVTGGRANGIYELVGARASGVFRQTPACCLGCVEHDLRNRRPPHYRRTHQVTACQVCPEHGAPLTTHCTSCGAHLRYTKLPTLDCLVCGARLQQGRLDIVLAPDQALMVTLAQVLHAGLNGSMAAVHESVRLRVLRERTQRLLKRKSATIGDNLAAHLTSAYGRSLLELLQLRPDVAPTFGWPALFLYGRFLSADPIANCLLIALLFDSINDYNDEVSEAKASLPEIKKNPKPLIGCHRITEKVLRDVLGPDRLIDVANRHGISKSQLSKWVAGYPGLSERRKLSAGRIQLRRNKRTILEHLARNPGQSRTQVARTIKSEITHVIRNDRNWLDRHLPVRTNLTGATASQRATPNLIKDREFAAALRLTVERQKSVLGRPRRLTQDRVVRLSGIGALTAEDRHTFPETSRAIQELTESVDEYYRRCLTWASKDLVRCRGRCDHIIELFVHADVSLEYVRALEHYASRLIARDQ